MQHFTEWFTIKKILFYGFHGNQCTKTWIQLIKGADYSSNWLYFQKVERFQETHEKRRVIKSAGILMFCPLEWFDPKRVIHNAAKIKSVLWKHPYLSNATWQFASQTFWDLPQLLQSHRRHYKIAFTTVIFNGLQKQTEILAGLKVGHRVIASWKTKLSTKRTTQPKVC